MNYLRKNVVKIVFFFFCVALSYHAFGKGLPVVQSHSETQLTVAKGSEIELQVNLANPRDRILWWMESKKVCMGPTCKISTKGLDSGTYGIQAIASNNIGSSLIDFQLKLSNKANGGSKLVRPKLINFQSKDEVYKPGVAYGLAKSGRSYAWYYDKLIRFNHQPQVLSWTESMKSSTGTIQFGIEDLEEFSLLPGGNVALVKDDKRRIIRIHSGTLRARQLDATKEPLWTLTVGGWLQLDSSPSGDFAVKFSPGNKDEVSIMVFSGQVRTIQTENKDLQQGSQRRIRAGTHVVMKRGVGSFEERIPSRKLVEKIFRESSPEIFSDFRGTLSAVKTRYRGIDVNNPLSESQKLIKNRHFTRGLYVLSQASPEMKKTSRWKTLFGKALGGVNLVGASLEILEEAYKSVQSSEIAFQIGLRYFENSKWSRAQKWFKKVGLDDFEHQQILFYYLGIIAFKENNHRLAQKYFVSSDRFAENIEIVQSIKKFRDLISVIDSWGAEGSLEFLVDSNLFQTSHKSNLSFQDEIFGLSGYGYRVKGNIWTGIWQKTFFGLRLGYSIDRLGWIKKSLQDIDSIDQSLYSQMRYGKDGWIQMNGYLNTKILGSERALDGGGLDVNITGNSWYIRPDLRFGFSFHKDPLPDRADIIDVISGDIQGVASDRSSRVVYADLDLLLWRYLRQEISSKFHYSGRTFTNSLVEKEVNSSQGLSLAYHARFWGASQISFYLKGLLKTFPDLTTPREDITKTSGIRYGFDMEEGGTFNFSLGYEDRSSTDTSNSYTRYYIATGANISL